VLNQPVREDHKNIVEQGFTLVELLIVIVILGILAGIVVFAVGNLTSDASKNACSTDVSTFKSAYQAYKAHNLGAAPGSEAAGSKTAAGVFDNSGGLADTAKGGPYLQSDFSASNGYDATNSTTALYGTAAVTAGHWAFDPENGTVNDKCNA
jgi:prepilin-type N-terminal cleavage/methylation domain-containing protein